MANGDLRVFISAVTSEFGKARDALASDLRARGAIVHSQSDFRQGPDNETLLKTLYDHIRDCHSVICLVGKRTGAYPPAAAAERFKDMLPPGIAEASYTQWEYVVARHFNRRVYIYLANEDWTPDKAAPPDERQSAFVRFLKDQGVHRTPFSTFDQLARAVLKEEFSAKPIAGPPPFTKPIILPYPSLGPLFKGREGFMQQLHESLSRGGQTAITSKALYGLGGIGKTRAAVEYAWAHRDEYSALLFVVAESPEALRRNLAALAATMVPDLDTTDDTVKLQTVFDWLHANPGWFLILDNVDTKETLSEAEHLLSQLAGGHVVVTSRLSDFSGNFEPLSVDVLPIDDAATFLMERTKGRRRNMADDAIKAREIAVELDELALALEQAGAYIAKHRLTFDGYLERWRSKRDQVLAWFDESVTGYPRAVAVTWQTSVAQLTEPGRRLLERLAWLAPEKVPEFLLDVAVHGAESENLYDALADLATYSLITRDADGPFFIIHGLVQRAVRDTLSGDSRGRSLAEALEWINKALSGDPRDSRNWPQFEMLEPHARAVADFADVTGIPVPTSQVMRQVGSLLAMKGLRTEAEPLMRRALAIDEIRYGTHHPAVAEDLSNLSELLQATNRPAEAEPLARRAVAIAEKSLGPNHPTMAAVLNNLAALLQHTNRLAEAEPLLRRALAIGEEALGSNHPQVGVDLSNLAALYRIQGRYAEAHALYQRSLTILEQSLGPQHPDVRSLRSNIDDTSVSTPKHGKQKLERPTKGRRSKPRKEKHKFFVSYATKNYQVAWDIVQRLEQRKYQCWIAHRDMRAGRPFGGAIVDAIRSSTALLLIFSNHCNNSAHILREVTIANSIPKIIIPYRIEDIAPASSLEYYLAGLHWISAFAGSTSIEEIINALSSDDTAN